MGESLIHAPRARIPLWRNRKARAVFYQAVFLSAVVAFGFTIYRNAVNNLRERGITSGFDFLTTESNFTISETLPIPLLEGGALYFVTALLGGSLGVLLLSKLAKRYGKKISQDNLLVTLALALLLISPGLVLYATGHTIKTVSYAAPSTYGIGILTGLLNTLKVSFAAVILGTVVGFFVGVARLSSNWLVSRLAMTYIEILRNIPLLLQIFFWYFGVLRTLPAVRQSINIGDFFILNNRGLSIVEPVAASGFEIFLVSIAIAGIIIFYYARYAQARQDRTGKQLPVLWPSICLLVVLPGLTGLVAGAPFSFEFPRLAGFNYKGGMTLTPEYASLLMALVMYSGAFIAEIVRSGIQAIHRGQNEAGLAIGLKRARLLKLVILPQAKRIIIPPLTANYLSTIKDSSLGVAIGYPELVSVGTTILDVSGRSMELIGLIMLFYMTTTLLISAGMNWYNARIQFKSK